MKLAKLVADIEADEQLKDQRAIDAILGAISPTRISGGRSDIPSAGHR